MSLKQSMGSSVIAQGRGAVAVARAGGSAAGAQRVKLREPGGDTFSISASLGGNGNKKARDGGAGSPRSSGGLKGKRKSLTDGENREGGGWGVGFLMS